MGLGGFYTYSKNRNGKEAKVGGGLSGGLSGWVVDWLINQSDS